MRIVELEADKSWVIAQRVMKKEEEDKMAFGVCKDCKWWDKKEIFEKEGKRYSICTKIPTCMQNEIEAGDMAVICDNDGLSDPVPYLTTHEDFGCMLWEKEE